MLKGLGHICLQQSWVSLIKSYVRVTGTQNKPLRQGRLRRHVLLAAPTKSEYSEYYEEWCLLGCYAVWLL
jgi:hypothetical protein